VCYACIYFTATDSRMQFKLIKSGISTADQVQTPVSICTLVPARQVN
jgi:hypothetical protein